MWVDIYTSWINQLWIVIIRIHALNRKCEHSLCIPIAEIWLDFSQPQHLRYSLIELFFSHASTVTRYAIIRYWSETVDSMWSCVTYLTSISYTKCCKRKINKFTSYMQQSSITFHSFSLFSSIVMNDVYETLLFSSYSSLNRSIYWLYRVTFMWNSHKIQIIHSFSMMCTLHRKVHKVMGNFADSIQFKWSNQRMLEIHE